MKTKIINRDLSIKQLQEAIESTEFKLLEKSEIVNPYLVFLEENTISTQPLSLREVDVLKYLNEGSSNKEISEKLFISLNTVKTHIRNIYTKLNINNRLDVKAKIKHLNI